MTEAEWLGFAPRSARSWMLGSRPTDRKESTMIGNVKVVVLDNETLCLNGWDGSHKSPSCNYTGGHFCDLKRHHEPPCRCACGATSMRNRWLEDVSQVSGI